MKMQPDSERDLASLGSTCVANCRASQTLLNGKIMMNSLHLEPLTDCGCCSPAAGLVGGGAFLFEDLATAKHGVSLLCRDVGGGKGVSWRFDR